MKCCLPLLGLVASLTCTHLLAHPPVPGDVWVVDDDAPADFADIQPTVDAAAPGDTVLVRPGLYSGLEVASKPISIVGDSITPVKVGGLVRLRALPAGEGLSLSNLELLRGLRIHDCTAEVRFADCLLRREGLCDSGAVLGSHRISNCESAGPASAGTIGPSRSSREHRDG